MEPHATALLIDDDPTTADVLRNALAGEALAFDVAYDLATAIRCLDSGRYSGVVVDLGLPQGSGLDVLRHMLSRGMTLPTVVISNHGTREPLRALIAHDHVKLLLSKPVDTSLLLNVIRGLCGLASLSAKEVSQPRRDRRSAPPEDLRDADLLWRRL
jgi:DNA-binding NtrC family response regulator